MLARWALARCASIPTPPAATPTARSAAASFSDFRPNCMRCSLASSSFRCSISRSRESSCSCCARISARSASAGRTFRSGSATADMRGVSHELARSHPRARKKSCAKNLAGYTDSCGSHVRSGRRQSMPSSSIDNCARVSETVPLVACGHTNRPRSSRFANKHNPSPSYHRTLIRSPRRPRNTNTCPENGLCSNLRLHQRAQPGETRAASRSPLPQSRSACSPAARSSSQALQQHAQQRRIGAAFDPHLRLPQFDVNRAPAVVAKVADPGSDRDRAGLLSLTRTGSNFMAGLRSPSLPAR